MHANLVSATGDRFGFESRDPALSVEHAKSRLGMIAAGLAEIAFAFARNRGFDGQFLPRNVAIGLQPIRLADTAGGELLGERAIGLGAFAEEQDARRLLVEAMND